MFVRKLTIALLATSALSFAGAAYAADVYSPPVEEAYVPAPADWSWTGIHFGVGAGGRVDIANVYSEGYDYNWNDDYSYQDLLSEDLAKTNWFLTGEIGADYQMGSFVVGIGGNYDFNLSKNWAMDSSYADTTDGSCSVDDMGCNYTYQEHGFRIGDSWALTGRLGFLANPHTLVYGLIGWGNAQVEGYSYYDVDDDNDTTASASSWRSGLVVGAGVETMLTKNLSLKGEYRFANYGSLSASESGLDGPDGYYNNLSVTDIHSHSLRAVLSWRLGM